MSWLLLGHLWFDASFILPFIDVIATSERITGSLVVLRFKWSFDELQTAAEM